MCVDNGAGYTDHECTLVLMKQWLRAALLCSVCSVCWVYMLSADSPTPLGLGLGPLLLEPLLGPLILCFVGAPGNLSRCQTESRPSL